MPSVQTLQEKIKIEKDLKEFKENIDNFIQELEELDNEEEQNKRLESLTDEQISEIRKYVSPYTNTITGSNKFTCLSHTNITKEYFTRLLTTTLIGFLYRMCDEYEILDDELTEQVNENDFVEEMPNPDLNDKELYSSKEDEIFNRVKYNYIKENNLTPEGATTTKEIFTQVQLTEDDEMNISSMANKELLDFFKPKRSLNKLKLIEHVESLVKKQSQEEQQVIKRFLNKLFEYNPDLHAKSAYHDIVHDPERRPLKPVSRKEKDDTKNMTIEQLLHTKVPPNDTFLRFNYYYDVNHEEMRNAVRDLYCYKPDIDVVINVFEQFDTLEDAEKYIKKHQDEIKTDILTLTNNSWNFIGPFKKNRERINFYNKNTEILEEIFKQQEADSKLGAELMKDRVRKKKMQNVKYMGKDSPEFRKYLKENPNYASSMGAVSVDGEEKVRVVEEYEIAETGANIDEDGIPEDCVKIEVTSINAKSGSVKTSEIYTKAKEPEMLN